MKNDAFLEDGLENGSNKKATNDKVTMSSGGGVKLGAPNRPDGSVFHGNVNLNNSMDAPNNRSVKPSTAAAAAADSQQASNANQLLTPPTATASTRLQVPPIPLSSQQAITLAPPVSRPASAARNSVTSSNPPPSPKQPPSPGVLPLSLREVMNKYRKEYLRSLFQIIKVNILIIIAGCFLAFAGVGMMTYSAINVMSDMNLASHSHGSEDSGGPMHAMSETESMLEKLGAILAGIGAFVNMVSVVFILDRRAILDRERLEKIDTYKRNRQQPRNLFEILLANAKQKAAAAAAAAAASASDANVISDAVPSEPNMTAVGVVITEDASAAANANVEPSSNVLPTGSMVSVKGTEDNRMDALNVPAALRRPSVSSSYRPRLESTSMAKAMAAVTSQQLKQLGGKSKGENAEIFVLSGAKPSETSATVRPASRTSAGSSIKRQQQTEADNAALQVHRGLEEWLKSSIMHTIANEFATEAEVDARSETTSLSIGVDRDSANGSPPSSRSSSAVPPVPQGNASHDATVAVPVSKATKGGDKTPQPKNRLPGRRLPGSNVTIGSVFRQMVDAQKTNTLYDTPSATDPEAGLPPIASSSRRPAAAAAAATQQGAATRQKQGNEMVNKTLNTLDLSLLTGVAVSKPRDHDQQQTPPKPRFDLLEEEDSQAMWATDASGMIAHTTSRPVLGQRSQTIMTDASHDFVLPSLPSQQQQSRAAGEAPPPIGRPSLTRYNTNMSTSGANNNNTNNSNSNGSRRTTSILKK